MQAVIRSFYLSEGVNRRTGRRCWSWYEKHNPGVGYKSLGFLLHVAFGRHTGQPGAACVVVYGPRGDRLIFWAESWSTEWVQSGRRGHWHIRARLVG